MKKCPKCGNYSIGYDSYRGIEMCMLDACSCYIIDTTSYSYLKPDPSSGTMNRVKVKKDEDTPEIIKKYDVTV